MKRNEGVYPIQKLDTAVSTALGLTASLTEAPERTGYDFGINVTSLAKERGKNPNILAENLATKIRHPMIAEANAQGPFLNIKIEPGRFGRAVVDGVLSMGKDYGRENIGHGQRVAIDMSSPNIAKEMSYGHLRSTIIGDSLARIYKAEGYEVIKDNHIGDWGTQFGNEIAAIKKWGNENELRRVENPIQVLQDLYVRFEKEAEEHPELRDEGRAWFKKLEDGDNEARRLWKLCVDLSMKKFEEVYRVLGVTFDVTLGESFYESMLRNVIDEVRKKRIGKESKGALIVDMEDEKMGVSIIEKSDGATLYMTRDLATAMYREKQMKADKAIYVVGEDQKLYFQQLFEILRRMGYKLGETSEHVYFGMVRLPEGKMSTRKGRTILLKDVIDEGLGRSSKFTKNKDTAHKVAIGALKWNDLSQDPRRSIVFDWDKALKLEGGSPYVQYTGVRAKSIIHESGKNLDGIKRFSINEDVAFSKNQERTLVRGLAQFPEAIRNALNTNNPSKVANFALDLA
ncbi:arginine--tRNA ligase, partial [Candidatus Woesebacteria bacterium]|nr:arginine--tRNA ligase [Candidatus Woesebacteria bacterium]